MTGPAAACIVVLAFLATLAYGIARIGWLLWRLSKREEGQMRRASLLCVSSCMLAIGVIAAEGTRTVIDMLRVPALRAEAAP